jgi:hypothetical protein
MDIFNNEGGREIYLNNKTYISSFPYDQQPTKLAEKILLSVQSGLLTRLFGTSNLQPTNGGDLCH